ncbi:MAG: hypothetical protein ACRDAI_03940, partial [Candidatus Rhabdochlamydia sp.]
PLQNWSAIIQCSGSKYSGISIPARKHALSIVGYCSRSKITFAFNVTYSKQAQEISYELSKKIKRYIENTASIKFWKILPYKNPCESVSNFIDNWLFKEHLNINIESIKLKKDSCFIIDRTNGDIKEQCETKSLCRKFFRQTIKFYSIVAHQENRIKKNF